MEHKQKSTYSGRVTTRGEPLVVLSPLIALLFVVGFAVYGDAFATDVPEQPGDAEFSEAAAPSELEAKMARINEAARGGDLAMLRESLRDDDPAVQAEAFEALAAEDGQSAFRDLLAILDDPSQSARGNALQLLDLSPRVDDQTARAALRKALADPDPLLNEYALQALALRDAADARVAGEKRANENQQGFTSPSDVEAELFVASDETASPREQQDAVSRRRAVREPDLEEQEAKLTRIEEAARDGSLEGLRRYLRDTDPAVQSAAFEALLANDERSAIRDLLAIIDDAGEVTRAQSLRLLNTSPQVDDATVRSALRRALSDPDPLLNDYAHEALAIREARSDVR